jgi:hypothetical protein
VVAPVLGGFALGHGLGVPYLGLLAALCLVASAVALSLHRIEGLYNERCNS